MGFMGTKHMTIVLHQCDELAQGSLTGDSSDSSTDKTAQTLPPDTAAANDPGGSIALN